TNGNTSQTFYDSLARVTSVKNAFNQTVATYSYPDFNTKISTNALGQFKTEYIDGLGRAYKAISVGEDNGSPRNVVVETTCNNRGQTESESLPHYVDESSSQISYVRYEYDIRGRVKKTISDFPGTLKDAEASINYVNPLYVETVDPQGHKKGTLKDVFGNNIEITEFAQGGVYKTTYEYDIQNNLVKLTDSKSNVTQIFYDSSGKKLKMIDPDMGTWFYEYDELGNLKKQIDAKNQTIEFNYDELNRLLKKTMTENGGATSEVSYLYDDTGKENCIGRLSKVIDSSGSTEFFYDKLGREIKSIKTVSGSTYQVSRAYDILDRLTALTYPDSSIINYHYDTTTGSLKKVSNANNTINYVNGINYNAKGQITTIAYGNNTQTAYTYGQDLRLSNILTQSPTATLQNLNYLFDKNGNITTLTDNLKSNIRTYAYDELNRLTQANNVPAPTSGYTDFNYQYDSIGNMTYKSDLGVMTYGQSAGPHAVTTAGSYSFTYDANGNMTSGKGKTYVYDVENRLKSVDCGLSTESYSYDGDGGRVRKTIDEGGGTTKETTYIGSLYEIENGKIKKHIFAGSTKVCTIEPEHTYYMHSDHLGSSSVITDELGNKVSSYEYTPYGTVAQTTGTSVTNYKFTGKELDSSGLYFYGARYYDPEIGRFITADTIVQSPLNPQTLNRYTYCNNNPINYIDPTGHWFWFAVAAVFIGAASGAAISAITGGDIGAGAICGAISGALFFAAGSAIGGLATALGIQEGTAAMTMLTAGVHTIAGAISGALGAVATGGNPGISAAIGGISAGISATVSGIFPISGKGLDAFMGRGLQRTVVGAILGGGISLVMGGSFGAGATQGAMTSAVAYLCNDWLHDLAKKLDFVKKGEELSRQAFQDTETVAGQAGLSGRAGGALDAYRHARWNELMRKEIGSFGAFIVSMSHEIFDNQITGEQTWNDFRMDTHNNFQGAFSGKDAMILYGEGKLKILKPDSDYKSGY
ncbi:MAG: RHS repeat-associated core domain-containing protein, partial [Candidatus Omnitrophota bacterium]